MNIFLRSIASILCACLGFQEAALAFGGANPRIAPPAEAHGERLPQHLALPQGEYAGTSRESLIHIQDAHESLDAQFAIHGLLQEIMKRYDVGLIGIEGASGTLDPSIIGAFPDADVRRQVAETLLRESRISGAEYYSITENPDVEIFGIEDPALYADNLDSYRALIADQEQIQTEIKGLFHAVDALAGKALSPQLRRLNAHSLLDPEKLDFARRWYEVRKLAAKFGISRAAVKDLENVFDEENQIDFREAEADRRELIARIKEMPEDDAQAWRAKAREFAAGRMSSGAFHHELLEEAQRRGWDKQTSLEGLKRYVAYIEKFERLDLLRLFDEISSIEDQIRERLYRGAAEREIDLWVKVVRVLARFLEARMTAADEAFYEAHRQYFEPSRMAKRLKELASTYGVTITRVDFNYLGNRIPNADRFYADVRSRNDAFVRNSIRRMRDKGVSVGVVVTGGFHADGVSDILKSNQVSHVIYLPRFNGDARRPYATLLTRKGSGLDEEIRKEELLGIAAMTIVSAVRKGQRPTEILRAYADELAKVSPAAEASPKQISDPVVRQSSGSKSSASSVSAAASTLAVPTVLPPSHRQWRDWLIENIRGAKVDGARVAFANGWEYRVNWREGRPYVEDHVKRSVSSLSGKRASEESAARQEISDELFEDLWKRTREALKSEAGNQTRRSAEEWFQMLASRRGLRVETNSLSSARRDKLQDLETAAARVSSTIQDEKLVLRSRAMEVQAIRTRLQENNILEPSSADVAEALRDIRELRTALQAVVMNHGETRRQQRMLLATIDGFIAGWRSFLGTDERHLRYVSPWIRGFVGVGLILAVSLLWIDLITFHGWGLNSVSEGWQAPNSKKSKAQTLETKPAQWSGYKNLRKVSQKWNATVSTQDAELAELGIVLDEEMKIAGTVENIDRYTDALTHAVVQARGTADAKPAAWVDLVSDLRSIESMDLDSMRAQHPELTHALERSMGGKADDLRSRTEKIAAESKSLEADLTAIENQFNAVKAKNEEIDQKRSETVARIASLQQMQKRSLAEWHLADSELKRFLKINGKVKGTISDTTVETQRTKWIQWKTDYESYGPLLRAEGEKLPIYANAKKLNNDELPVWKQRKESKAAELEGLKRRLEALAGEAAQIKSEQMTILAQWAVDPAQNPELQADILRLFAISGYDRAADTLYSVMLNLDSDARFANKFSNRTDYEKYLRLKDAWVRAVLTLAEDETSRESVQTLLARLQAKWKDENRLPFSWLVVQELSDWLHEESDSPFKSGAPKAQPHIGAVYAFESARAQAERLYLEQNRRRRVQPNAGSFDLRNRMIEEFRLNPLAFDAYIQKADVDDLTLLADAAAQNPRWAPIAVALASHPDPLVRAHAALALGGYEPADTDRDYVQNPIFPVLTGLSAPQSVNNPLLVRTEIPGALLAMDNDQALQGLTRLLNDPAQGKEVHLEAVLALRQLGDWRAVEPLLDFQEKFRKTEGWQPSIQIRLWNANRSTVYDHAHVAARDLVRKHDATDKAPILAKILENRIDGALDRKEYGAVLFELLPHLKEIDGQAYSRRARDWQMYGIWISHGVWHLSPFIVIFATATFAAGFFSARRNIELRERTAPMSLPSDFSPRILALPPVDTAVRASRMSRLPEYDKSDVDMTDAWELRKMYERQLKDWNRIVRNGGTLDERDIRLVDAITLKIFLEIPVPLKLDKKSEDAAPGIQRLYQLVTAHIRLLLDEVRALEKDHLTVEETRKKERLQRALHRKIDLLKYFAIYQRMLDQMYDLNRHAWYGAHLERWVAWFYSINRLRKLNYPILVESERRLQETRNAFLYGSADLVYDEGAESDRRQTAERSVGVWFQALVGGENATDETRYEDRIRSETGGGSHWGGRANTLRKLAFFSPMATFFIYLSTGGYQYLFQVGAQVSTHPAYAVLFVLAAAWDTVKIIWPLALAWGITRYYVTRGVSAKERRFAERMEEILSFKRHLIKHRFTHTPEYLRRDLPSEEMREAEFASDLNHFTQDLVSLEKSEPVVHFLMVPLGSGSPQEIRQKIKRLESFRTRDPILRTVPFIYLDNRFSSGKGVVEGLEDKISGSEIASLKAKQHLHPKDSLRQFMMRLANDPTVWELNAFWMSKLFRLPEGSGVAGDFIEEDLWNTDELGEQTQVQLIPSAFRSVLRRDVAMSDVTAGIAYSGGDWDTIASPIDDMPVLAGRRELSAFEYRALYLWTRSLRARRVEAERNSSAPAEKGMRLYEVYTDSFALGEDPWLPDEGTFLELTMVSPNQMHDQTLSVVLTHSGQALKVLESGDRDSRKAMILDPQNLQYADFAAFKDGVLPDAPSYVTYDGFAGGTYTAREALMEHLLLDVFLEADRRKVQGRLNGSAEREEDTALGWFHRLFVMSGFKFSKSLIEIVPRVSESRRDLGESVSTYIGSLRKKLKAHIALDAELTGAQPSLDEFREQTALHREIDRIFNTLENIFLTQVRDGYAPPQAIFPGVGKVFTRFNAQSVGGQFHAMLAPQLKSLRGVDLRKVGRKLAETERRTDETAAARLAAWQWPQSAWNWFLFTMRGRPNPDRLLDSVIRSLDASFPMADSYKAADPDFLDDFLEHGARMAGTVAEPSDKPKKRILKALRSVTDHPALRPMEWGHATADLLIALREIGRGGFEEYLTWQEDLSDQPNQRILFLIKAAERHVGTSSRKKLSADFVRLRATYTQYESEVLGQYAGADANKLQAVKAGFDRMIGLIDYVISYLNGDLNLTTASISNLVADVTQSLRAPNPHVRTSWEIEPGLTWLTDEIRLKGLLGELLNNANNPKFGATSIQIRAFRHKERLRIQIENNGQPIPSNLIQKIFRYGVHGESGGTGMGASFAKDQARALGGQISYKNVKKDGRDLVRYEIRLPEIPGRKAWEGIKGFGDIYPADKNAVTYDVEPTAVFLTVNADRPSRRQSIRAKLMHQSAGGEWVEEPMVLVNDYTIPGAKSKGAFRFRGTLPASSLAQAGCVVR